MQAALTALTRTEARTHVDPREPLDLHGLHLTGAQLTEADLAHANLRGTTLTEAHLFRATLTAADLAGATLTKANLREAELSTVLGLTPMQVATTYTNEGTELPSNVATSSGPATSVN
ncbi:pentapeptide repeat-containing protein [Streptomyces sp. NPDC055752]